MSNATFYPRLKPVWRAISAYADKMIKEAFSSRHDRFTDDSPYLSGFFSPRKMITVGDHFKIMKLMQR